MENSSEELTGRLNQLVKHSDIGIALGVLGALLVMIIPVAPTAMDLLLVTSVAVSISILLVAVYASRPLDFSVFPTVLLFATLFRLALNVASSRLILLDGHVGEAAAGRVIQTFGQFVVGGNYIVGAVIFVLLVLINFVVITKGAGRVAEVAARFILDSMPGKQMSIDADLNAGLITEDEARSRRSQVEREADFYGAMDGASKFVRGDAIAGILITAINILGGLAIGVFQKGIPLGQAATNYTLLTIGDGLVSQIPALIVSTAAGIIVTRSASGSSLSRAMTSQVLLQPRALGVTAAILGFMGMMPGIPVFPFFVLASIAAGTAYYVHRNRQETKVQKEEEAQRQLQEASQDTHVPPQVDPLEVHVGYGLVKLVDPEKQGDLVERVHQLRKEFAKELGIVVPKVRIKDNLELQPSEYTLMIRGVSVGRGELLMGHLLAMDPGGASEDLPGIQVVEPVFGLSAKWIRADQKEAAQIAGYTVVDHSTIIATHLSETIRKHAHELVGRQELQALVDNVAKTHPKVVEELIPNVLTLGVVLKVCQNLLKEQVPMRDLLTILETLANHGPQIKDPETLTEYVRAELARTITQRLSSGDQELEVITFSPGTEETLMRAYKKTENGPVLNLEPRFFEGLVQNIQGVLETQVFKSGMAVLLCHPVVRGQLKKLLERFLPDLSIISANEVAPFAKVRSLASVEV